jgi:WhiB family transcriptional regulator, redox-sensing transcriptional regulator
MGHLIGNKAARPGLQVNLTDIELHRCNYNHESISQTSAGGLLNGFEIRVKVMDSRSRVPENWFIDPIRLGVAGAYSEAEGDPLAWQADALCAQTDPEAFFPEKGGSTRDAKRICSGCDVKAQCLDYALANDERFGIWGGLSERERRKLKKRA